jgi:four helix bundle protein
MQDFRNLVVWQRARKLTKSIYDLTASYPESEEFGLKSQMRRAVVSICTNIAEGCGRDGDKEFRRFLYVAFSSGCELECELILSWDLAFITEAATNEFIAVVTEIKRMLTGLIAQMVVRRKRDRPDIASDLLAQVKRLLENHEKRRIPEPGKSDG